jgi:hypothetical protein
MNDQHDATYHRRTTCAQCDAPLPPDGHLWLC